MAIREGSAVQSQRRGPHADLHRAPPGGRTDHLSDVPSFEPATAQAAIARNIINPPIDDWQRPIR